MQNSVMYFHSYVQPAGLVGAVMEVENSGLIVHVLLWTFQ